MKTIRTELGVVSYKFEKNKIIVSYYDEEFMILYPEKKVKKKEAEMLIKEAINEFLSKKE